MAKDKLEDWDEVAANNLDMGGISLAENVMRPPAVNNEMREHMAQVSKWLGDDTVAAAGAIDIGALPGRYVTVTGSTTITSLGTIKAGTIKYLKFTGTPTLTYNATSFILPTSANIVAAAGDTAIFVSEGAGNWRCAAYSRATGAPVLTTVLPDKGYIYGLALNNNSTDPVNDIDIAVGGCASDAVTPNIMSLTSLLTKRLDAAWAVGSGNGGLDTGSIANTTYHIYLIRRPDTGVVDACFSASASSPTTGGSIPAAYTQYRRIGSIIRSAGAIRLFDQYGDFFQLKVPALDINVSIGVTTAVLYPLTVPNGIKVQALLNFSVFSTSVTYALLTSPDQTDSAPSVSLFTHLNGTAGNYGGGYAQPMTDTAGRIRVRATVAATSLFGTTNGWIDKRGMDA